MTTKNTKLFGGALSCALPDFFVDGSRFRDVPDHQELFVDTTELGRSLIIEIVDAEVTISNSAAGDYFIRDYVQATDGTLVSIDKVETSSRNDLISSSQHAVDFVLAAGSFHASRIGQTTQDNVTIAMCIYRLHQYHSEIIMTLNAPLASLEDSWRLLSAISSSLQVLDTTLFT